MTKNAIIKHLKLMLLLLCTIVIFGNSALPSYANPLPYGELQALTEYSNWVSGSCGTGGNSDSSGSGGAVNGAPSNTKGVAFDDSQSSDTGGKSTIDDDGIDPSPTGSGSHQSSTSYASGKLGALHTNFFALNPGWASAHGLVLGDVAALTYKGKTVYAVYGDNHVGDTVHAEISVKAAMALSGVTDPAKADNLTGVHTIVYPGTHTQLAGSVDQSKIDQIGAQVSGGGTPSTSASSSTSTTNSSQASCCPGSSQTQGSSNVSLTGNNPKDIFDFFISKGLKPEQAAGILGNIAVESAHTFDPTIVQGGGHSNTPTGSGYGIVQWTPPSKLTDIIKAANISGKPSELGTQLQSLWAQLDGKAGANSETRSGADVKAAASVSDAVRAFQGDTKNGGRYTGYERPADETASLADRIGAANAALTKYGNGASPGSSASSSYSTTGAADTCSCPNPGSTTDNSKLAGVLKSAAQANGGKTAISVSTIDGNTKADYSGDNQMPTRSSYKTYTAYATLKAIEDGKISWSTPVWQGQSVAATMTRMIVNSDNNAAEALRTNSTIGTPSEVTKLLQGAVGLSIKTVMGSGNANDPKGSGSQSTANDYVKFLVLLEKHKLPGVNKNDSYTKLLDMMKRATTDGSSARDGIAKGVGGSTEVADKPGWASGSVDPASNDVGIVYLKNHTYILSILTDKPDQWTGVAAIAKAVNDAMGGQSSASGSSACSSGAITGDLSQTVSNYAWPDYHTAPYVNPKQAYADAVKKARSQGRYVGGIQYPGIDCGGFVTTAMIDSGFEPKYNSSGKGGPTGSPSDRASQWGWLQANWQKLSPSSTKDLKPGDVAINGSHTYMYVGKIAGFNSIIASASLDSRAPMAGHETPADPGFSWYRKK